MTDIPATAAPRSATKSRYQRRSGTQISLSNASRPIGLRQLLCLGGLSAPKCDTNIAISAAVGHKYRYQRRSATQISLSNASRPKGFRQLLCLVGASAVVCAVLPVAPLDAEETRILDRGLGGAVGSWVIGSRLGHGVWALVTQITASRVNDLRRWVTGVTILSIPRAREVSTTHIGGYVLNVYRANKGATRDPMTQNARKPKGLLGFCLGHGVTQMGHGVTQKGRFRPGGGFFRPSGLWC